MSIEMKILGYGIILGLIHIFAASKVADKERGFQWAAGPRDEPKPPLGGLAGRLERASNNFRETFPFFAALILMLEIAGTHSGLTLWGASLYLGGRIAFLPLYVAGVFLVRSIAWGVSMLGILLLIIAVFRG